jgi:hypothetical protein
MKVNILGKGVIPGIGTLAPKYDVELSETEIRRLVNLERLRIGDTVTGLLTTKKNVNDFFKKPEEVTRLTTPIEVPKKVEPKKVMKAPEPVIEKTVPEVTVETLPDLEIKTPDVVVEVTSTSEKIGNVVEVEQEPYETPEITIEETTEEEEEPQTFYKKKKKRNR